MNDGKSFVESLPTAPGITRLRQYASALLKGTRPPGLAWLLFGLLSLGALLEICLLALYPLWFHTGSSSGQSWLEALWPWLGGLYRFTIVESLLPLLDAGSLSLLVLLVGLSLQIPLWWLGNRAARYTDRVAQRTWVCIIWGMALLMGGTMVFSPLGSSVLSLDMLRSGLYGRMIVVYAVNPYTVSSQMFSQDPVVIALGNTQLVSLLSAPTYGPAWLDCTLLMTLIARENVGVGLLGLRLMGLVTYLLTIILLWHIVGRVRPEWRCAAVLLYAWNPLVLVLGIGQMHVEIVAACLLCVALWCWQRGALLVGWLFLLLAVLFYLPCCLLLPVWVYFLAREYAPGNPLWRWGRILLVSGFMLVMAYAPYWQGWGWSGLWHQVALLFQAPEGHSSLVTGLTWLVKGNNSWLGILLQPGLWAMIELVALAFWLFIGLWLTQGLDLMVTWAGWLLVLLACLYAFYQPEALLVPLALILCAGHRWSVLLLLLLEIGSLSCDYYWLHQPTWEALGLLGVGLPILLWGWIVCIQSAWKMVRARAIPEEPVKARRGLSRFSSHFSRPSWLTKPSLRIVSRHRLTQARSREGKV
ncbi:hypothetical protein [Ktedonospora formicarum]|uniref:DUF2029 domain-containing protein n=1 Tax=Ktedonospora formicarum TaxID=2778364 RepID=A0A8J3MRX1_9CHLR|nr:hypothetical protein [Ktedonospora formicarum]GHO44023.1 hypothetical protein KSX_21860 [Ktedonospora formicarum]